MTTSDEFFDALEADAGELATVVGELYFEYHRGTYTTQAAVKKGNRAASGRCTTPSSCARWRPRRASIPRERLAELWQRLLLNQFHDILPGSSIAEVYEDAARDHAAVIDGAERLVADALGERRAARRR